MDILLTYLKSTSYSTCLSHLSPSEGGVCFQQDLQVCFQHDLHPLPVASSLCTLDLFPAFVSNLRGVLGPFQDYLHPFSHLPLRCLLSVSYLRGTRLYRSSFCLSPLIPCVSPASWVCPGQFQVDPHLSSSEAACFQYGSHSASHVSVTCLPYLWILQAASSCGIIRYTA